MNWKNLGLLFQRAKKAILESGRNSSQTQGRESHKWRESICLLVLCIVPTEGSSSWKLWFMLSFKEAVHIVWEAMFTCSVYCANWRLQFVEAVFYVEFKEAVHIVWEAMFLLVLCIVPTEGSSSWKLWFMLSFKEAVHIVWEAMFTCSVYCTKAPVRELAVYIAREAVFHFILFCRARVRVSSYRQKNSKFWGTVVACEDRRLWVIVAENPVTASVDSRCPGKPVKVLKTLNEIRLHFWVTVQ